MKNIQKKGSWFMKGLKKKKRKFTLKMPDVYVLLFLLVVVAAIATYSIPAGEYDRIEQDDITIVDPNSFQYIEQTPASISDIFMSIPEGMIDSANIIFLILFLGGAFKIIETSRAINAGIFTLIKKLDRKSTRLNS